MTWRATGYAPGRLAIRIISMGVTTCPSSSIHESKPVVAELFDLAWLKARPISAMQIPIAKLTARVCRVLLLLTETQWTCECESVCVRSDVLLSGSQLGYQQVRNRHWHCIS